MGWTTDPGRDAQLEYRLSIYHARVSDTGSYTCKTPMNISHTIDIIVKEVRCPNIATSPGLILSTNETKMNTKVVFSCNNGNDLIGGPVEAVCYPSGSWSSPIPACMNITCPEIIEPNNSELIVRMSGIVDNKIYSGTKAYFSCSPGFYLEGTLSSEATCLRSGKWSIEPMPKCLPISCSSPENPESGFVNTGGKKFFHTGDMVKFRCKSGYMMEGQPVSRCNERGDWSNLAPTCVRACTYPGSVIGGTISDVKFYYKVGDTVSFKCSSEGLVLKGAKMLECLGAGVWSSSVPNCSSPNSNKA
ncbi:unnamed protein product [Lepeophtheirus salmonis]|uniref:(salmon louse) hypothetical protein n=1 Tax=Lepeophtheirus salmonis TaxID=72036 RepID=A0A7R8D1X8_LEPSM|nr:unnamed protein product [Lepeophtheirus salmonis]CAF3000271.1 unnamed protein product [Lepeophtheirus salmonis]